MKKHALILLVLLSGCSGGRETVTYVCEEPLEKYLDLARANIENDYEIERSRRILTTCPDKGFHRRYTFEFPTSALVSRDAAEARVRALWCNDATEKTIEADLKVSPAVLSFQFTYPWSTATGKYPRTEFRLNRNTLKGGFFEDLNWTCRLRQPKSPSGE